MVSPEIASQQLTVAVLFWGSAVVIGLAALDKDGARAKVLWGLTGLFVIAGFLVRPLWARFPDISAFLTEIAAFPPTWFFLVVTGFIILVIRWRASPDVATDATVDVRYGDLEIGDQIARLEARAEELFEGQRDLPGQLRTLSEAFETFKANADPDRLMKIATNTSEALGTYQMRVDRELSTLIAVYVLANLKPSPDEFDQGLTAALKARAYDHGLATDLVERNLGALGADMAEIQAAQERANARIMGDAQFFTITERDEGHWEDGDAKRLWHLWAGRLQVLRDAYTRVADELKARARLDHRSLERLFRR